MRHDVRIICIIGLILFVAIFHYYKLLKIQIPPVIRPVVLNPNDVVSEFTPRWAFATLLTASGHSLDTESGVLTYVDLAVSLGKQMRALYPSVPRLAIIARGQVSQHIAERLETSAGYTVIWRDPIIPRGVQLDRLPPVYKDQFMKFWVWMETNFDRVVYVDADTFFTGDLDFYGLLNETSSGQFLACPTPWSKVEPETYRPTTLNGGFFVVTPSEATFQNLMSGTGPITHFALTYTDNKDWFDHSEMGVLMREYPNFVSPSNLSQYCSDIQRCCVTEFCKWSIRWTHTNGPRMVHGFKPSRDKVQNGDIVAVFRPQVIHPFVDWGYSEECMMREFVEPQSSLIKTNIL